MAYNEKVLAITLEADSSLALYTGPPGLPGSTDPNYGFLFRFVKVTSAHHCGLATAAANEIPIGILFNKPQHLDNAAEVAIFGVVQLLCGTGGLAAGQPVKSDSAGKGVAATMDTDPVYAVTILPGAAGGLATVLLAPFGAIQTGL